ncbi:hypothetical protein BK133_09190 [Paenibacillus sp. FSL H8-0548]|uniref:flagellar hook-length control protein FliK n=1 Tax=Paenibacillus sp. FSL H8-0548 TaxID=1920422 RepID=UPI0009701199|nr:flagellar hook-length control protein FliK [Paenibacillus sp. FSL H8-0548]OMF36805.1 hypothetical protein BK133_09190 [Paenibacillus sp. FSL H8-0548]
MEMAVSQAAAPQAQTTATGQLAKNTGGAVFQQTLVQQINGTNTSPTDSAQNKQLFANVVTEAAAVTVNVADSATLTDLMSIVDGLLEKLSVASDEGDASPVEDEQQLDQLAAALDQMSALLALLGIPVPVIQPAPIAIASEEGSVSILQLNTQATSLKSNLQDTLLQVQAMLQQGTSKLIGQQDPTVLIAKQLQELTAILESEPVDSSKKQTKSEAVSQQLFTAKPISQADVSVLLQRLSQQAAHPAVLSAAIQNLEQAVEADASPLEVISQVQLGNSQAETPRGITPLTVNSAPATSFVVADEFAKSMTGMIVQKFDISTLNGVSEAKLMLFPEHLGQVDVRITMQNGLLTAIFQTDTAMAKDMLDNQMAQLRAALQAQGLMVDKLEVSQGQSAAQLFQQQQGQGSNQQQASKRQSGNGEDNVGESQFETDMVEQASIQGLGFGRGLNVKA